MELFSTANLTLKLVCLVMIAAAVIDVWKLKVPNVITIPMILAGWIYWASVDGWGGLGFSLLGTVMGLALLILPYAVGGMGAGDVKLLAGLGAWVGAVTTFWAFCVSAIVGGLMALAMIAWRRQTGRNIDNFKAILVEFVYMRDFSAIADAAAFRKSSMMLLPYGLPLTVGTIGYFLWTGMI